MNKYSPILLFAFKRLDSLRRTVESLKSNSESVYSDLFVFVDGPRTDIPGEKEMVEAVRGYVRNIDGFNSVHFSFSESNMGLAPSIIQGVSSVIHKYGKVIVLEDDLILSNNFLSYMNQGLTAFEKEQMIFSVCAYSNVIKVPDDYPFDTFFCHRSSSWGWGTWIDRWNTVDWNLSDWDSCKINRYTFNRWGGSDCFRMLKAWKDGKNQSWAIRFCYSQFMQNRISVFPIISKVNNVGYDSYGTNCRQYNRFVCKFDHSDNKLFKWPDSFEINQSILKSAMSYHGLVIRAKTWLRNRAGIFLSSNSNAENRPSILIMAPFPPPTHGSSLVSQLIRQSPIVNKSFDCDYINISTSRKISEIKTFHISLFPIKILRFLKSFFLLFWKLTIKDIDLCYLAITCHGSGFLKDAPFVLLCKLFRKRIVIHQHNKGMSNDVNKPIYKELLNSVYRNTKVILLSDLLYPDIKGIVKRSNVEICPNGIQQNVYNITDHPLGENIVPQILFLSNMLIEKGVVVLLKALSILKRKGVSFYCHFVGSESMKINDKTFDQMVQDLGLGGLVSFEGPKYGQAKDDAFLNSNIFVFPSFNEAFPLVLLEAMQYSLPIVTTDVGGIPDIVINGENGLIVPSEDVDALAEAIETLLVNPTLRFQMGRNGFSRFSQKFTQQIFEEKICDILKGMLCQ